MNRIETLIVVCGVLFASATAAQPEPSPAPGVFSEVLDVRVINLEVVVTDKAGTPISGLGPQDFRLYVDGGEVPIDYFTEVRGGVALESASDAARGDVTGMPALAAGEPVGTSYLVFIDDYFSRPTDRNKVLQSLADDVVRLQPEDRMAVVAFDGSRPEMLSTWTSSYPALERVFERAMERPAYGLHRLAERRQFEVATGQSLDQIVNYGEDERSDSTDDRPVFGRRLEPQEQAYVTRLTDQINRSVAAVASTLRSFAMPPGRKVLILLSGGWPYVPAEYVVGDLSRVLFSQEGVFGNDLYGRLVETANLIGYTIYPVDVPGLDRDLVGADIARLPEETLGFDRGFVREREVQASLGYIAEKTGGKALINAQRIDALELVQSDTRSYYWLGFSPQRDWNDERHDVRIELSNPDFRTRSRAGFLDSSRTTEVNMVVESTLLFGSGAGDGSVDVEVGAAELVENRRMEVPIRVTFPLDEITFLPAGESQVAQVELRVAVLDKKGNQAPVPVIPMALRVDEVPETGARGSYQTRLLLRRLPHEAVVAVHDMASGRILTTGFDIQP